MDIIIPLARDRKTNYYELRMTLRSIAQNLTGFRHIYIIGEKPGWVKNVIHIPAQDIAGKKSFSIFRKMMIAAKTDEVSDKFISWSDDTYLLKPLDVSQIKDWYDSTLKDWLYRHVNIPYRNIIRNTYDLFPHGLFYNVHTPCIYEKDKFRELAKVDWMNKQKLVKSVYFNTYPSYPAPMKDPKKYPDLFYSSKSVLTRSDHELFKTHFPNPSVYETDNKAYAKAAPGLAEATG